MSWALVPGGRPAPSQPACCPSRWAERAANVLEAARSCGRELERNSCPSPLFLPGGLPGADCPSSWDKRTSRGSGLQGEGAQECPWKNPLPLPAANRFRSVRQDNGVCMRRCVRVSRAPGTEVAPGGWCICGYLEPGGRAAGAGQPGRLPCPPGPLSVHSSAFSPRHPPSISICRAGWTRHIASGRRGEFLL